LTRIKGYRKTFRNKIGLFKRKKLFPLWHNIRWPLVGLLFVFTLSLGYIGFEKHSVLTGQEATGSDIFYRAIRLIYFESGDVEGPVPWELDLARYMVPFLAAFAALQALVSLLKEQWQQFKLRFISNHVVICGLGERGLRISEEFLEQGNRVVVVENDGNNNFINNIHEQGAYIVIGDATDEFILRQAGLHRASILFSVCPDDSTNAEVAIKAHGLVVNRHWNPLRAYIHLADQNLINLLLNWQLNVSANDAFRVELFNVSSSGARIALSENLQAFSAEESLSGKPLILIAGLGGMGRSLLLTAVRLQRANALAAAGLKFILVDRSASAIFDSIRATNEEIATTCDIYCCDLDLGEPRDDQLEYMKNLLARQAFNAAFICFDHESRALTTAKLVQTITADSTAPIIVRVKNSSGLASLFSLVETPATTDRFRLFPLLDKTCNLDVLLNGMNETIARSIHENYLYWHRNKGIHPADNPSLVSWDELPEGLRESNRHQASRIITRLKAIGCIIEHDFGINKCQEATFSDTELEMLALMEHQRWCDERLKQGWKYAEGNKNIDKKTSPHLVPWDKLDEEIRELDRETIRGMFKYLSLAGLRIIREKNHVS